MSKKAAIRALFVTATFLYWVSLYLYVPTLSTFVKTRTADLALVGTVLSMYGLWQAIMRIPTGIGVDKLGHGKPFIVTGMLFSAAGSLVMAYSQSVTGLIIGRTLTGFAAATWVPLIAVFSGMFDPKQAVFATSLLTLSSSVGRVLATSLNGFLNNIGGYPLAFIISAIAAGLAIVFILFTKEEQRDTRHVSLKSIVTLFKRVDVMLPSTISLVAQISTWGITFSFLAIRAENLGGNDIVKSLLVTLNLVALTSASLLNAIITKKVNHVYLLAVGIFFFSGGVVLMVVTNSIPMLYVGTMIMGLANGFVYPTLMGLSIRDVDQSYRTSAMGIHQSVYAVGMFAGPWLGGIIANSVGLPTMFALSAAFTLSASYILLAVYRRHGRRRPTPLQA